MRAAILISGYLRSFDLNLPKLKSKIFDKFDQCDIYFHISKNSKDDRYLNKTEGLDKIVEKINPVALLVEDNLHFSTNKSTNNLLNSWLKYYKLNELKKINEQSFGKYDIVIKLRPDLDFFSDQSLDFELETDLVFIPEDSKIDKTKLANSSDPYICDILAFGCSEIMDKYFDIYKILFQYIQSYKTNVSETILWHYLNNNEIKFKTIPIEYNVILSLCNVFAIAGDSGSGKTTLGKVLKEYFSSSFMLECDRYHKWERKDENWSKFTHLNPEANYLTKLNEDIFDLKIGKSIFQVDYDHSTGKFTEPEKIDSSDNIIVCGLHSLYNTDNLYNLKIFMDTDEKLKYFWKIRRDVKERGHDKEKVLEQIMKRKDDYLNFIYPQKNNSDLVINFHPLMEVDYDKVDSEPEVGLKIKISKKYNILKIVQDFKEMKIDFEYKIETKKDSNIGESFNEISFKRYQKNIKHFKTNTFYDYILYLILNINNFIV